MTPRLVRDLVAPVPVPSLEIDELVRAISVNRATPHLFFLGAGASISSGVPSAGDCIWRWKREIFVTKNPELEKQFSDASLSGVRTRIQQWLDTQGGFPERNSSDEYGFYAGACFPIADDRRQFFQNQVHGARPHVGYRLLSLLAEADLVDSIWTTNFDGLAAKAAGEVSVTPVEIGLDSAHRIVRPVRKGELLCVSLHGDYRYDALKNLPSEIKKQEVQLSASLTSKLSTTHCIVVGYSGRDQTIMKMFIDAYASPGSGRLYWCGYGHEALSDDVLKLFATAEESGRIVRYVPTYGFDDLIIRATTQCLPTSMRGRSDAIRGEHAQSQELTKPFAVPTGKLPSALIKSNAFPIECPSEILEACVEGYDQPGAWTRLRSDIDGYNIVAGLLRGKVLAVGTMDALKDAFGDRLKEMPKRVPIDERELFIQDGVVLNVLTMALTRALAQELDLCHSDKDRLWSSDNPRVERLNGIVYDVHDAVNIHIRMLGRRMFMVLSPTVAVQRRDGEQPEKSVVAELRRKARTGLGNKEYNEVLKLWRQRLFNSEEKATFEFPRQSGAGFRYKISRVVAFAALTSGRSPIQLSDGERKYIAHQGTIYPEPKLLFSSASGTGFVKDEHPIRGMLTNRPYDFALTARGLEQRVRLGVVCPRGEERNLTKFLDKFQRSVAPDTKLEYLLEYPGFSRAFGLPLEVPEPGDPLWATCPEPPTSGKLSVVAQELRASIVHAVKSVSAASPSVILMGAAPLQRWQLAHFTRRRWPWGLGEGRGEGTEPPWYREAWLRRYSARQWNCQ